MKKSSLFVTYNYEPHPRSDRDSLNGPPTVEQAAQELRGDSKVARFNRKVGLTVTMAVGTMWCAYIFTILAFISAPAAFSTGSPLIIIAWIAQTFLQLTLLPIIIVGQNIQAKAADLRAESTYKDAEAVLHEAIEIQRHLKAQDKLIAQIIQHLERK